VFCTLATIALLAQPLHLTEVFARARDANADLRAAHDNVRAAQAGIDSAGQLINPTFTGSIGPDEPKVTAEVDVKLPILGQRGTAVAAAERDAQAAQADALARSVAVRASVRRAYAALAAAQERARLARDAFDLAADLEQRAQSRVQTGLAPQLEAVQAGLARKRAARERDDRAAALTGAREDLGRLIAAPDASTLEAADANFPLPGQQPLDALLPRAGEHPEVQAFLRQQDAALARASRERAAIRPIPDLSLTLQHYQDTSSFGLRYGIAFDLPVLTWNSGRVAEARAQADAAASLARGALANRTAGLRSAHARLSAAEARAKSFAAEIVPAAQDLVKMARDAWELGRTPLTTLLQAQNDLTSVRADASDAALAAQQALADLEEAAGEGL
jgi:cobalt-zinc-cadmium efflux system outer membrane protein